MTREPTVPRPPDTHFLRELADDTDRLRTTRRAPQPRFAGAPAHLHDRLERAVEALAPELVEVSRALHRHPEPAFEEVVAVDTLTSALARHGIAARAGAYGVPTAFEATTGTGGGPRVAILSEYDALPGVGHGCGHNVIGAAGLGAVLALHALAAEDPAAVPGTVVHLGTPAEEGHSGKEHMARGGAFAPGSLDAAIMVHPYGYDLADQVWLGRRVLSVDYAGVPAHASAQPFMGRNALDAAVLAYQGIGLLRQQMAPVDRIHAIITEGGTRQSIITERARMELYVRSKYPAMLRDLSRRVDQIVRAAAAMSDCGVDVRWDEHPPTLSVRTSRPLEERWVAAQRRRGREPLPLGVVPEVSAASTDFGNVSFRVPGIHPLIKVAEEDVALHTREFAAAAGGPAGDRAVVDGAYGLAQTALDVLWDADLRGAVAREFADAGGPVDVATYFEADRPAEA